MTSAPSTIVQERDARLQARRARFMRLVEGLRRDAPRDAIHSGDNASSAQGLPEYRVSDRLLHLFHEYDVRSHLVPAERNEKR